jgi:hypothetical protein
VEAPERFEKETMPLLLKSARGDLLLDNGASLWRRERVLTSEDC